MPIHPIFAIIMWKDESIGFSILHNSFETWWSFSCMYHREWIGHWTYYSVVRTMALLQEVLCFADMQYSYIYQ